MIQHRSFFQIDVKFILTLGRRDDHVHISATQFELPYEGEGIFVDTQVLEGKRLGREFCSEFLLRIRKVFAGRQKDILCIQMVDKPVDLKFGSSLLFAIHKCKDKNKAEKKNRAKIKRWKERGLFSHAKIRNSTRNCNRIILLIQQRSFSKSVMNVVPNDQIV